MKRREFIAATAALLVSLPVLRAQGTPRPNWMLWHFGKCANYSRRMAQRLARTGLDRGQEPARRIPLYPTHQSLSSFGRRVDGSQSRSGSCRRATSSRRPEIGNRHHSDFIRGCGRSRGTRPRPKPRAPRWQHNGLCDLRARRFYLQRNRNPPGTGSWRLENCALGQSEQPNTQAGIGRGDTPHSPEHGRGSAGSRGDHGRGTRHGVCLGRRPARRCNHGLCRSSDQFPGAASCRARGGTSSARELSLPTIRQWRIGRLRPPI